MPTQLPEDHAAEQDTLLAAAASALTTPTQLGPWLHTHLQPWCPRIPQNQCHHRPPRTSIPIDPPRSGIPTYPWTCHCCVPHLAGNLIPTTGDGLSPQTTIHKVCNRSLFFQMQTPNTKLQGVHTKTPNTKLQGVGARTHTHKSKKRDAMKQYFSNK